MKIIKIIRIITLFIFNISYGMKEGTLISLRVKSYPELLQEIFKKTNEDINPELLSIDPELLKISFNKPLDEKEIKIIQLKLSKIKNKHLINIPPYKQEEIREIIRIMFKDPFRIF